MLLASIRVTFLGWDGSFVGRKRREVWKVGPLCIFWTVWKARYKIVFEDSVLFIQRLKSSFVYFLWLETKLFIKDGHLTLVGLFDWLSSH